MEKEYCIDCNKTLAATESEQCYGCALGSIAHQEETIARLRISMDYIKAENLRLLDAIDIAQSEGRRAGLEEAVEIVKHQPHHEADGLAHFRRVCSAALFVAKKPKP